LAVIQLLKGKQGLLTLGIIRISIWDKGFIN
jgi:hypothetical protein